MRIATAVSLIILLWAGAALSDSPQTDWSGGPGATSPLADWTSTFDSADGVSWLAVPGQLTLSTEGLTTGVPHNVASFLFGAFGVEVADVDNDGYQDIIGVAENAAKVIIWYNDGQNPPSFSSETIDSGYAAVAAVVAVDLNGDQLLDLVTSSGVSIGKVNCYLNQGGSPAVWVEQNIDPQWGETWDICTIDVDNDGHLDVLGTSLARDSVVWWRNDGQEPIGWTRQVVDSTFNEAHSARGGDLDGDGHTDIVGCGTLSNEVAWWRNSGTEPISWTKTVLSSDFVGGRAVRIADIDSDGDLDFAAVGFNSEVKWWRNDGGTPVAWSEQVVYDGMSAAHHLQIADMNGDGMLDLIAADYQGNSLHWWANGGGSSPTWTHYRPVHNINRPLAVDVGDVDGDGALEIVGSSNGLNQFIWYEVTTFTASGSLTSAILDRGSNSALDVDWNAEMPAGTSLQFQVRGGDDPDNLGPWSAPISAPGPLGVSPGRYFQYQANLATTDSGLSPILKDVTFSSPVSAVLPRHTDLGLKTFPNPANPRVIVAYEMPASGNARLEVFDTRGHRVRTLLDERLAAGPGQVAWDGTDFRGRAMSTGVYYVILKTTQGKQRSQVTIIR